MNSKYCCVLAILFTSIVEGQKQSWVIAQADQQDQIVLGENSHGRFGLTNFNGRDFIVTPGGQPFVALGINHMGVLSQVAKHTDWDQVVDEYRQWGCTTVGSGGGWELSQRLPWICAVNLARTSKFFTGPGGKNPYDYPDVFDSECREQIRNTIRRQCERHRGDPLLVGYCWTDTPCWDIVRTRALRQTDWVSEIRRLGENAPGKQRYVSFLKERYKNDIQKLSDVYELDVNSYDDLLSSDFASLDPANLVALSDDQDFLGLIAEQFYEIAGSAQHEFDPSHLVFGEKYLAGDYPDNVLQAALPYIDVLSVQPGDGYVDVYPPSDVFRTDEFDRIHGLTGKPIFLCDHQISFATHKYPKTTWTQKPSELEAADATYRFILEAFSRPYVIGYMRCQYIDVYDARRGGLKQGLLREDGTPYTLALNAFRDANHEVISRLKLNDLRPPSPPK